MIDLKATNKKLQQRSRNIIRTLCGPSNPKSDEELDHILETCNGSVKLAVVTILLQISAREGTERLEAAGGVRAKVLKQNNTIRPIFTVANGTSFNDFVLCIDGGGSKCAAVLLGPDQQEGKGEAGECNV
jgi:N-acetylmuramic acid 6-phosphate etherase